MEQKKEKKTCLILTGGTVNKACLQSYLEQNRVETIVCVDGALEVADAMKLDIDYLVGDFDTVPKRLLEQYKQAVRKKEKQIVIREFNPVKDATDTQIAIQIAMEEKTDEILIFGATGTRIDHMLANIHLLVKPLSLGIPAYILDEYNKIYLINKNTMIRKAELYGPYFSLLPFGGDVTGVTLRGFKYNVSQTDFKKGDSLGVSNELLEEEGFISFQTGTFAVFESKD
ncbi:thiamine diphosphokinase [Velocimicrobium porci]|uniref:Thiamine diphosphokinase n=1 Tax=Velocimicrobium porci TaxID=2606634 RepID=A0A6L5XYL7_9FIRM|nr:thiamine diphosphokinase [Velocimicrobium porci]MSS63043.1 thiamine diphosphokinase [Velocimicrobium porci]